MRKSLRELISEAMAIPPEITQNTCSSDFAFEDWLHEEIEQDKGYCLCVQESENHIEDKFVNEKKMKIFSRFILENQVWDTSSLKINHFGLATMRRMKHIRESVEYKPNSVFKIGTNGEFFCFNEGDIVEENEESSYVGAAN